MGFKPVNIAALALLTPFIAPIFLCNKAYGQSVLPQGIGIVKVGYRYLTDPSQSFDENGNKIPLSSRYSKSFTGPEMLKGTYGEDLKLLATWINKYDSGAHGGLLDRLTLGNLKLDVKTNIQISMVGLGLGLSDWLTVYAGAPLINISVQANLSFSGENTAKQIKSELGDLAPDQLQDGLDRAAKVNTNDILDAFEARGYSRQTTWNAKKWGDTKVGFFLDPKGFLNSKIENHEPTLNLELSIPTGYLDNPELLVDSDLGKGYYQLYGELNDRHGIAPPFFLNYVAATAIGFPAKRKLRVPDADSIFPGPDRLSTVTVHPGFDFDARAGLGYTFSALEPYTSLRYEGHTKDSFTGTMSGNYDKLAEDSNYELLSSEIGIGLSTVNAYKSNSFPIPFLGKLSWKHPWSGSNKMSDDYVELTVTAFFPTPFTPTTEPKQEQQQEHQQEQQQEQEAIPMPPNFDP